MYRGRGGFENDFAAEDQETDPDRWGSQTPFGQECWQILAQWIWNLRQAPGQRLWEQPGRDIEWAGISAGPVASASKLPRFLSTTTIWFTAHKAHPLLPRQRCNRTRLFASARSGKRPQRSARLARCACLGPDARPTATRSVSTIRLQLPPSAQVRPAHGHLPALRWPDVPARALRRQFMTHLRSQQVHLTALPADPPQPIPRSSRAERSHQRLSWRQRRSRNAGPPTPRFQIAVSGIPARLGAS